ncbi:hypothetical protein [Actinophytocola glycyrrhizae]|uniref:PH domain-containing protein n=1 Tax=Actinophytocola glycyrrhizae TaxID=2044873 RepID=A0ABV9RXN6_9PSEU
MSVRYNPVIPIAFIVLGVGNFVLALVLVQSGGSAGFSLFLGPLLALLGVLQLTRSYFEFDPHSRTIAVKALIGPMSREFGGAKGGRLHVNGNRIMWTRADGQVKKVPVSKFMARGDQWRAVLAQVG